MEAAGASGRMGRRLQVAIVFTGAILVAEVVGGYAANSLALLSDAGHVFTDLLALLLAWVGVTQIERPPTQRMTYGYHRLGILIAIVNALLLVGITGWIFYEAFRRLQDPPEVQGGLMLVVATVGLGVNLFILLLLRDSHAHNLPVRSAALHVLGDALGSVGAVVAGGALLLTGWSWVDPAVSVLIGLILAVGAWGIIRESVAIFVEATPGHVDIGEVIRAMYHVAGVRNVHDLHVWTIAPNLHALSCHVELEDMPISRAAEVLRQINTALGQRFHIGHATIQVECPGCQIENLYCTLTPETEEHHGAEAAVPGRHRHP
ncbi:MAG: cation transporter [Chloroflexi bacterium]|nr:cation transporter [Chloroflexota bacterium]